ncbi:unnamed protein product [Clavelina lepadiformis]|uniref:1,4-alpha-glucan branching enzyme n=1 Tax=Clavelina lepadiformis TaxID=159417 RepID=A0ABP0GC67_CLALP
MYCQENSKDLHLWGVPEIEALFENDPKIREYEKDIRKRYAIYEKTKMAIEQSEGFDRFTQGFKEFGVFVTPEGGVMCKEWIPNARAVYLSGDFNNWEKWSYQRKEHGKWQMYIHPNTDGSCRIQHLSELKLFIETEQQQTVQRISPWATYVVGGEKDEIFKWMFWNPPRSQVFFSTNNRPQKPIRLRIYEAHIGISSDRCEVASYRQFTENVLLRVNDLGFNCVLLMAIMEHSVYSSMGSQSSHFYACSSRFGTPEDLKQLVNVAHGMGITVIMDVVHHQASSNVNDGLNMFDGTRGCYFKDDEYMYPETDDAVRECHQRNDFKRFDLTKWEVLRFLLSNFRYYMDEFRMDGFRFNGVHNMIYHDQGADRQYANDYSTYFGAYVDTQSMAYMMLANDILHRYYSNIITIAEDKTEMPSLCRPLREGGLGFDYKLGLSVPNKWMKLLDEKRDEDWNMGFIFHAMIKKRPGEKVISLPESRKESMVGKKTLISKLMGEEICQNMSDMSPLTPTIDRGLSLHKMIRLMTHSLAGDSYMNFIGNEFGHPDFLQFPSPHNNDSYHYARRRFELCDDEQLRFKYLKRFDQALNQTEEKYGWLASAPAYVSRRHDGDKVFVYERAGLLFLFNFHPCNSYPNYRVGIQHSGIYKIILDTDNRYFGGHDRNHSDVELQTQALQHDDRQHSFVVYLPSRCALVMSALNNSKVAFQDFDGSPTEIVTSKYDVAPAQW